MENPVKDVIMEGAAFARENHCDFIVALGGGAVIDSSSATERAIASLNILTPFDIITSVLWNKASNP